MKKIFIVLLLSVFVFANEEIDTPSNDNIVKTSELELFLFKMGFQSLLNDVDSTKSKVSLNEEELKKLNQKVSIIMDEVYKSKRVLKDDSTSSVVVNSGVFSEELELLKNEVALLKKEIIQLKEQKIKQEPKKITVKKKKRSSKFAIVRPDELYVRSYASADAKIIDVLKKGEKVEVQRCSKFGWCKLKGEKKYVAKFLLDF